MSANNGVLSGMRVVEGSAFVAIPSLFFYRFFQRKVDELVIYMEQEALKLVEVLNTGAADRTDAAKPEIAQVANR